VPTHFVKGKVGADPTSRQVPRGLGRAWWYAVALYYPLDAGIGDKIREQDLPELKIAILAQNGCKGEVGADPISRRAPRGPGGSMVICSSLVLFIRRRYWG
jgi:hypothetical protein